MVCGFCYVNNHDLSNHIYLAVKQDDIIPTIRICLIDLDQARYQNIVTMVKFDQVGLELVGIY